MDCRKSRSTRLILGSDGVKRTQVKIYFKAERLAPKCFENERKVKKGKREQGTISLTMETLQRPQYWDLFHALK